MVWLWLWACGEPKPGEVGYEDCDPETFDGPGYCAPVELCCLQTGPTDVQCRYETDGGTFFCEGELDCADAIEGAQRAVCTGAA